MKKILSRSFFLALFFVVPTGFASADIIQSVANTTTTDAPLYSGGWTQTLGTGISGTLTEAAFQIYFITNDGFNGARFGLDVIGCSDEAYTLCSGIATYAPGFFLPAGDNAITFTGLNFQFAPTGYYKIAVNYIPGPDFNPNRLFQIRGSAGDTYSEGETGATGLSDIAFNLVGIDRVSTTPDPVIIIPGIFSSAQIDGQWVIDPIAHSYDNLIATLDANGYTEGKDLFTFPYDWRLSNESTGVFLRDKINEVQGICECDKVDLVAHSMGGLVARSYIQGPLYDNDVDQLIFLGTPQSGAPKAYLMWEAGENDISRRDQQLKLRLAFEANIKGYDSLYEYIHSFPITSLSQILPVYDYITDKDSGTVRTYSNGYPRNVFLENVNNNLHTLLNSGVKIANFIGDNNQNDTLVSFEVVSSPSDAPLWQDGKPDGFSLYNLLFGSIPGLKRGVGDGTVPINSASLLGASSTVFNSGHLQLPTLAEAEVYKTLTGQPAGTLVTNLDKLDAKLLYIQLLSPVDMVIIAPDGKRTGKDFATGQKFNEIPGAFYSGYQTDNEYITIPDPLDGEYKIMTQGTENGGEYTIVTSYISDATSTQSSFVGQTVPNLITSVGVNVDNSHPENLQTTPSDTLPPEVSILSPVNQDYARSQIVPTTVNATDADSGVFNLTISFDGVNTATTSLDLFFLKLGNHAVSATATDFMNNVAATSTTFRVVATVDSTILDINREFVLGWITNKKSRDTLLDTLNKAVELEKRIQLLEEKILGKPSVIKRVEKLEKRIDKVLGKEFIKELNKQRGKTLNEQGYQLLLEDIQWLLDN